MSTDHKFQSIGDLVAQIPDGTRLAVPKDPAGAPMAAVRSLIRSGVKDIHLITVPTNGWATEWLVGAGAVKRVETSGVSLGEFGGACSHLFFQILLKLPKRHMGVHPGQNFVVLEGLGDIVHRAGPKAFYFIVGL